MAESVGTIAAKDVFDAIKAQIDEIIKANLGLDSLIAENENESRTPQFEREAQEIVVELQDISYLPEIAIDIVKELKGSLQFIFAIDERSRNSAFVLHHVFGIPAARCMLHLVSTTEEGKSEFPSLALNLPVANWHERKIADLLGLTPAGHPDPRRLVLHEDWPEGRYPLREDFDEKKMIPRVKGTYEFQKIEGEGVFEIPVGPVHAGIIEPGHFRFSSVGERILHLELRMFYKHRGIERLMRGKTLLEGALIAERISGDETVANVVAYSQAIERAFGVNVPERARALRAVFLELERLHCHLADIAGAATDIAFSVGAANAAIIRERIMSLCESISGSRFLRGVIAPGGLRRNIDSAGARQVLALMDDIPCELNDLESSLLNRSSVVDRFAGTGSLDKEHALNLGAVGPVARACGIPVDARVNYRYGFYATQEIGIITRNDGDVSARVRLKFDEIRQSMEIIKVALTDLPDGIICIDNVNIADMPGELRSNQSSLGWTEAPRGQTLCWVEMDSDSRIANCRWRTPSFNNWPALPYALQGDIVPDFPLVNKSFNLSYAGTDL